MTIRRLSLVWLFILCSLVAPPGTGQSISPRSLPDLQKQLGQITQAAQGRVGIAARVLETTESVATHGNEPFPMQCIYKFLNGMTVLPSVLSQTTKNTAHRCRTILQNYPFKHP